MKQKRGAFFLLLGFLAGFAAAQETRPVIQLNPFFIEGVGVEESRLIVSLVQSYLSDIGVLVNFGSPRSGVPADTIPDESSGGGASQPPDYTINGTIRLEQDSLVFHLEIMNAKTAERHSFNSVYKSAVELTLKTRSVLETAFSAGGSGPEKKPAAAPEAVSENLVIGTWKGEPGTEIIRLHRGGRGVAIFSSGVQMVLSYSIENNVLKVRQVSPNSERFYYPLPPETASQIAAGAEPMSWELSLYERGNVLWGVKFSTGVRMENGAVAELLPGGDVRETLWTKLGQR
jgi:hypothetical protein